MDWKRPNILVAIADDWAWPHAGAYGCRFVNTPAFDRVSREGALFVNAFTAAPTCTASRASFLTGRHPWSMEAGAQLWGYLPAKYAVYPDLLEAAGYWVGHTYKGWGPGSIEAGGRKRNPAGPAFNEKTCQPLTQRMSKNDYTANFADFLARKPGDAPFCFWYGAKEPHRAYEAGSGLKHGKRLEDVEVPPYLPDCEEVRSDLLDYALEVERFDQDLGKMIELLEARGELDDTVIVVTGDNGKPFPRAKSTAYENGCHVPLAIRWGGACPGRTITDFISFIDLAPTFLTLAGIEPPAEMAGRAFVDLLRSRSEGRIDPTRDCVITGRERHGYSRPWMAGYPIRSIVTDDYLYLRNFEPDRWPLGNPEIYRDCDDSPSKSYLMEHREEEAERFALCFGLRPPEELYRRSEDIACIHNLAEAPEHQAVREALRARLEQVLREIGDPRIEGRGWQFECVPFIHPRQVAPPEDFPKVDPSQVQTHFIPEGETFAFDPPANTAKDTP
jgi:N-sulfoglucosamine sulfohydrolase